MTEEHVDQHENYQSIHVDSKIMGLLPPKRDPRNLLMKNYLVPDQPPVPDEYNLEGLYKLPFVPYHNQSVGSCTISSQAEAKRHWERKYSFDRDLFIPEQTILDRYFRLSGGQDTGLYELDALKDFIDQGFTVEGKQYKITGFTQIYPIDQEALKRGIFTFGGIKICYDIKMNCYHSGEDDIVDYDPNSESVGLHSMYAMGYEERGIWMVHTWNRKPQLFTWAYVLNCVTEAYTCLDESDIKQTDTVDFDKFKAHLQEVQAL